MPFGVNTMRNSNFFLPPAICFALLGCVANGPSTSEGDLSFSIPSAALKADWAGEQRIEGYVHGYLGALPYQPTSHAFDVVYNHPAGVTFNLTAQRYQDTQTHDEFIFIAEGSGRVFEIRLSNLFDASWTPRFCMRANYPSALTCDSTNNGQLDDETWIYQLHPNQIPSIIAQAEVLSIDVTPPVPTDPELPLEACSNFSEPRDGEICSGVWIGHAEPACATTTCNLSGDVSDLRANCAGSFTSVPGTLRIGHPDAWGETYCYVCTAAGWATTLDQGICAN